MIFYFLDNKFFNQSSRQVDIRDLTGKEYGLLMTMLVQSDEKNIINKSILSSSFKVDNRTWNKYWNKLAKRGFIIKIPDKPKEWMVDPNIVYFRSVNQKSLINTWDSLHATAQ